MFQSLEPLFENRQRREYFGRSPHVSFSCPFPDPFRVFGKSASFGLQASPSLVDLCVSFPRYVSSPSESFMSLMPEFPSWAMKRRTHLNAHLKNFLRKTQSWQRLSRENFGSLELRSS